MALIVEDGNGLDTAESYISVEFFTTYHEARGGCDINSSDLEIEMALRLATEYIDIRWKNGLIGFPISETQALSYPTDYFITDPVSLPIHLRRATAEYAMYALSNDLFYNNDNSSGPGIRRILEKVGPIETETEYTGSGIGAMGRKYPVVSKADALMRIITSGGNGGVYR